MDNKIQEQLAAFHKKQEENLHHQTDCIIKGRMARQRMQDAKAARESKEAAAAKPAAAPLTEAQRAANSALGTRQFGIIKLLAERRTMTADEILTELAVDIRKDAPLLALLRRNPRIDASQSPASLAYKPEQAVQSRADLVALLQRTPGGVPERTLVHAYRGVLEDVESHSDSGDRVVYWRDPALEPAALDADILALYRDVSKSIPAAAAEIGPFLDRELPKLGLEPCGKRIEERRRPLMAIEREKKRKRREVKFNAAKATNAHLPELFGPGSGAALAIAQAAAQGTGGASAAIARLENAGF